MPQTVEQELHEWADENEPQEPRPSALVVAVYELDRHYGGPEEGGWWYDAGTLMRVLRVFRPHQERKAWAWANRVNRLLEHRRRANRRYRSLSSVLYAGGHYAAGVYENTAPPHWPERRPHYE